jgi:hypothetical protein
MSGFVPLHWDGHHVGHAKLYGARPDPGAHEISAELVYLDDRRLPQAHPQKPWDDPAWVFSIDGRPGFRLAQSELAAYKDGVYVLEEAVFRCEAAP